MSEVERRQYFRINDEVTLEYEVVKDPMQSFAEAHKKDASYQRFSLISELYHIDNEKIGLLQQIRDNNKNLAAYLDVINEKIHLVAQLALATDDDVPKKPSHKVNISAGGIAFFTDEIINSDELVDLKLIFYPSFFGIFTRAKVVSCRKNYQDDEPGYIVAAEFTYMSDSDREALIRLILERQANQIRLARQQA